MTRKAAPETSADACASGEPAPSARAARESIAACLIVQNERERLPAALASVAFCDEVIVVDGGSADGTGRLARTRGATVIENPWPGFARQRNIAIDAASSDWILEIDADERVSPRLRHSVEDVLTAGAPTPAIAVFPLRNRFLGAQLGPSAKYPTYRTRLFRRNAYRHDESLQVHEGIAPRERPLVLVGDLDHELAETIGEALADMWRYARLESRHLAPTTARGYAIGIILRPLAKFAYRSVIEGGWRDGWRGILKIALDAVSDALVWTLVAASRRPTAGPAPAAQTHDHGHFGRRSHGPAKIVAVAARGPATARAVRWLSALGEAEFDVALISDEPWPARQHVPGQTVRRVNPLAVQRAVEVEMDLRVVDALVAVGARARYAVGVLPPTLRPRLDDIPIPVPGVARRPRSRRSHCGE